MTNSAGKEVAELSVSVVAKATETAKGICGLKQIRTEKGERVWDIQEGTHIGQIMRTERNFITKVVSWKPPM